jgi:hypothetical protein|tara:strand:- start:383 stop:730 length:348 start_codon:yes stop_codon:yes gene_type:complete
LIVRSVGDDPRARFTTGAFVFLILSPLVLSFLSLAVSSRSLVETNKYLLFSFLTLRNDKTQVAEAEVAEMAAEVAAEDGAVRAAAAEAEAAEMAAEVVAAEVAAAAEAAAEAAAA